MSASEAMEIQALLRAHAPHATDALRGRVLALEPARRRQPSRRLALALASAVVGAAVAAALVHGLAGSSPKPLTLRSQPAIALAPAVPHAQALTPSVGSAARLQQDAASLQVRVSDVSRLSAATSEATTIVTSLGGYAQSVVYRTPASGGGAAYLELRVPVQNVRIAVAKLSALGTLVSQRLSTKDLQHDFEVESAQIAQLRREAAALEQALRDRSLPDAQRVLLQIRLADAKLALSQRLHARAGTVSSGTTARVSLVLTTQKTAVAPPHRRGRLGRMLHSALGFLGLEGTIALYVLIVISPLALAAALVALLLRARRRREEDRLLAT